LIILIILGEEYCCNCCQDPKLRQRGKLQINPSNHIQIHCCRRKMNLQALQCSPTISISFRTRM
jgi:hypothetical protein